MPSAVDSSNASVRFLHLLCERYEVLSLPG